MPTNQVRRINLDRIYPPFLERYLAVLAACRSRGAVYFATRGFATYEEQDAIHAQGRTAPGKIVTNAKGGQSNHNFTVGIDSTHDSDSNPDDGLQPDWDPAHYQILGKELKAAGLDWGASYRDLPHAGWPGYVTAAAMEPLRVVFENAPGDLDTRIRAVWAYLDAHSPTLPAYPALPAAPAIAVASDGTPTDGPANFTPGTA